MSFQKAASFAEIPDGGALAIELNGQDLALVRHGETVYAIEDVCSHADVPLSEGDVETGPDGACEIECWLHGSRFDVRTGVPVNLPATQPVPTYATQVDGDAVLVDLDTPNTPTRS